MPNVQPPPKTYLRDVKKLAFYQHEATPEFWDAHWQIETLQAYIRKYKTDGLFVPTVKRHLAPGGVVLEGGCGRGQLVHALQYQGYRAIGVDFASQTVQNIQAAAPELDVRLGDVRALDLPDSALDGYLSVGVIEHFWEGHEPILREMRRTLKVGGFLFVSFPFLSPLRRLKAALGFYPSALQSEMDARREYFYQFALDLGKIRAELAAMGFTLKETIPYGGLKGFKDEVAFAKPFLQEIYDGRRLPRWKRRLDNFFKPFAAHMALLVLQKTT